MAFAGLTQRSLVVADGFRYPLQRGVEFHRLRIPSLDDVSEASRGDATPHRRRHTAHPADEGLQHRAGLLIAGVRLACGSRHEVEICGERAAPGCGHQDPSVLSVRVMKVGRDAVGLGSIGGEVLQNTACADRIA